MANTITHKRSSTSSDTPSASDLSAGEIAINTADAKLFIKKSDNSIATFESGSPTPSGSQTAITSILNASLVVGRDADNDIDFGTDNQITFRVNAEDQIKLQDGALVPITDNNIDLGTSSIEFKNAFFDGTVTTDFLNVGTISSVVKQTGSYFWFGTDGHILYFGANFEVSLQHIHNIGLRLNSDKTLSFRDSGINIGSPADGVLDINAEDEIELNSTLIDINGAVDISGNTDVGGTLIVTGNTTLSGTTRSIGNFDVNTNKFNVNASNGNTAIAGTLDVDSTLTSTGDFDVNTNKFTVNATSGNTAIAGNLDVTGTVSSVGNFDVNTNKFNVIASSGNTSIAGTLDVTGAITGDSLAVTTINTSGGIDVQNSDTTLTRASAGVIAVEGNEVLTSATGASKGFATAMAIAL